MRQFIRREFRNGQNVKYLDLIYEISEIFLHSAECLFCQRLRALRQNDRDVVSSVESARYHAQVRRCLAALYLAEENTWLFRGRCLILEIFQYLLHLCTEVWRISTLAG